MDVPYLTNLFGLRGRNAIITGATGGLGSAIALALAKAGANIVFIEAPNDPKSNALHDLLAPTEREITSFSCDLASAKSVRECFRRMWAEGVVPDILVNVAGVVASKKCENATDEDIDFVMAVNQRAVYISMQEFGRKVLELGRKGKIINTASIIAFRANINVSVYGMTKGAVAQMTKSFSNEWAAKGINVNAIAPGFIRTRMTEAHARDEMYIESLMQQVPAARWGVPEDLVGAAIYLASPASDFVNGVTLIVDGGLVGK